MNAAKPLLFLALLVNLPSLAQDSLPRTAHAFQSSKPSHEGVSVSTKKTNGKVEIKVRDNGNGIPQKVFG